MSASPAWVDFVRPHSKPGLSSCFEEGRLTLDGVRICATAVDVYAMRLVEWAIANGEPLIICPAEPFGALAALTAAAAHIQSMVDVSRRFGEAAPSGLKIAVVTEQYRVRGIYRRLGVSGAPLIDVAPAASLSRFGRVAMVGRERRGLDWSTIFVSKPSDVNKLKGIDFAVVEIPCDDQEGILKIEVPTIVIAHNPADPLILRLAKRAPIFAWDDEDLAALPKLTVAAGRALDENRARLERAAAGVVCAPVPIMATSVVENASLFWQDIGPLLRAGRNSLFARELAAAAFVLFYDLLHLAMPTAFYESHSRPLHVRLREIERAERLAQGELKDLYLPMVAAELHGLLAAIGDVSPKTDALLTLLRHRVGEGKSVLVVARTAELARLYGAFLRTFPDLTSVRVTSGRGVAEEYPVDTAVLTGMMPSSSRHLYTTGIAEEILVLAYDSEIPIEDVPGNFTESDAVRRAIAYQNAYADWLARDAQKARCWELLTGEKVSDVEDNRPNPPHVSTSGVAVAELPPPPDAPPGLWDGTIGSLGGLSERLELDVPPRLAPDDADDADDAIVVDALRIEFIDGRWMLIDRRGTVTKYHPAKGAEAGFDASRLNVGDEILVLDGQAKKDLLAKVLEVAGEMPELAVPAAWIDYWRQALNRGYIRFGTYRSLRTALAAKGCTLQVQSVRLWVVGQTIGPRDPQDIRRLGEVLDDRILIDSHGTINGAIESLRGAHVRLGNRIGALSRRVGGAAAAGHVDEDEVIDEKSGLTAADFRDSIEILTIRTINEGGNVPYAVTGQLRSAEDKEADVV
jgi:hypothetical protein